MLCGTPIIHLKENLAFCNAGLKTLLSTHAFYSRLLLSATHSFTYPGRKAPLLAEIGESFLIGSSIY